MPSVLRAICADITVLDCDAIVNAANCTLLGGGGVDGAIHRAAGPELLAACREFGGCRTGEARITPGFRLKAKFIIHTPGPIYRDGRHGEPELLQASYRNSLLLAQKNRCRSIAFSCISTGVYHYPKAEAAAIAVACCREFPGELPDEVIFCCFSEADLAFYTPLLS